MATPGLPAQGVFFCPQMLEYGYPATVFRYVRTTTHPRQAPQRDHVGCVALHSTAHMKGIPTLDEVNAELARRSLSEYVRYLDIGFTPATHHELLIDHLEAIERRDIRRLMVFMPPGSAKSTYCSHMFPSWYVGRNPKKRIIEASHTADIAEEWGRKVRNTIKSPEYAKVFDVAISGDSSAAYRWDTTHGGGYFAAGVLGNIMGKRSDLGIIDDPVKSRQDADSSHIRDRQWAWYKADFWTRLKPNACQILIMTRWHEDDLAGRLLNDESEGGEGWHVIELPMEAEADDPLGRKPGERLWPEWFTDEMVVQAKRDQRNWWALYQQKPRPDEGNILKANWWRKWPKGKPEPECLHIFHSWDTAFSEQDLKTNSYSARTSWGVFRDADGRLAILLLGAWRDKCDYPTLRREARRSYMDDKPDRVLIEKKASGQSLIQDMRASGVPVSTYQPDRDKVARAYAVQAMLESGMIYYPDRKWAQEVIDECAAFPAGTASDYVDTCTQAWLFVRNGQWVEHPDNPEHETKKYKAAPAYG